MQRFKSSSLAAEYLHMNGIVHGDLQGVSFVTGTRTNTLLFMPVKCPDFARWSRVHR
jgi:hypothetical protein